MNRLLNTLLDPNLKDNAMITTSTISELNMATQVDDGYDFVERLLAERVKSYTGPLFTTDANAFKNVTVTDENTGLLWRIYLSSLPEGKRQHYNCRCCRDFIEKYGSLVMSNGKSLLFNDGGKNIQLTPMFRKVFEALEHTVNKAKITGVFLSSDKVWGTACNVPTPPNKYAGQMWTHLHGVNPQVYQGTLNADQKAAEKKEDFGIVNRALAEYKIDVVKQAVRILEADALDRSEKTLGIAKWFLDIHSHLVLAKINNHPTRNERDLIVWNAVATAPPGFCHLTSSMISTLLDDLKAGLDFDTVSARWSKKMHPLKYQRPTAPPSDGAIAQAEKLLEAMDCASSLRRRRANADELQYFWQPTAAPVKAEVVGGVFDYLKRNQQNPCSEIVLPRKTMTYNKFIGILPGAKVIEVMVPRVSNAFVTFVTAVDLLAKPILQWDRDDCHNPVSWFVYQHSQYASKFNLAGGTWVKALGLCDCPAHWFGNRMDHFNPSVSFVLEGCSNLNTEGGNGLFPEILRSEFHAVRSVIEAHSRATKLEGEGGAAGLVFNKGQTFNQLIRVDGQEILIDRWE